MISIPPKGDNEKRMNAYFTPLKVDSQVTPDMTVRIQPGSFWTALNTHVEYIGGNSPTLSAPTSNAKWVVIVINDAGLVEVLNGISGTNPELPPIPANKIPLSGIFIGDTTTQITADMVFDIRPVWSMPSENIPNLAGELADRPTTTQMNSSLATKADMVGTDSAIFTLNQDQVGVSSTDVELVVERGSEPNVSIRWSETSNEWQFSNDGTVWGPIGVSAGSFYTQIELDGGQLDSRYYERSLLDGGLLDARYYTESESNTLFASMVHSHASTDITDFTTAVNALIGTIAVDSLSDVVSTTPTNSEVLVFNTTSSEYTNRLLNASELADITLTSITSGQILQYNGTLFVNHTIVESDISDLDKYDTVAGAIAGNFTRFGVASLEDAGVSASDFATITHDHVAADVTDFSATVGTILTTTTINTLSDVVSVGATAGHILAYNDSTSKYTNRFLATTDLLDVEVVGAVSGEILQHNGVKFINHLPVKADITDFTDTDYVVVGGTVAQTIGGDKTLSGATALTGGLTTTGASTNINTTELTVTSSTILLNNGQAAQDGGIEIDRGVAPSAKIFWDETGDQWTAGPNGSGQYQPITIGAHAHLSADVTDFAPSVTAQMGSNTMDAIQDVNYSPAPVNNEYIKRVAGQWTNVVPVAADISDFAAEVTVQLGTNVISALSDVVVTGIADRHVMAWDGTVDNQWENRLLVKVDVSDFVESDYVHVTGTETISGIKTFSDDIIVAGDLTVSGTTTTIDSTVVAIADNMIVLNKDEVGIGVTLGTAGIEIERGSLGNVSMYWDEATDTWRAHNDPGGGVVISNLSFEGHGHLVADVTDISVNALAINQLAGISTTSTIQSQIDGNIARVGDIMDAGANLAFSTGGEVTGLPATPSGNTAATSRLYVDNQDTAISLTSTTHIADLTTHLTSVQNTFMDALNLPTLTGAQVNYLVGVTASVQTQLDGTIKRIGDTMNLNADLTLNGGELLGLPATPSVTAATSKEYVDTQISTHATDATTHLTSVQNTFMDALNLPTLTGAQVNYLVGVTASVQTQIDSKSALAVPAVVGNLASLSIVGDLVDSGVILNDAAVGVNDLWSASKLTSDLATKSDKVSAPTVGNFAGLDINGNLTDSGSKASDFATTVHTHVVADVTDFNTGVGTYVSSIQLLGDVSNVTDASATGDLLQKTPTGWQNVAPTAIVEFVNTSSIQSIGGDKTFTNNVTMSGDLTVNGTVSTINAVDLNITDKNITLNNDYTGLPSGSTGSGIKVVRGEISAVPVSDAVLVWDETIGQWKGGIEGAEIILAQLGVTVAQPDYAMLVGTGSGTPQYTTTITVPAPSGSKQALQVFVNGLKQIEGVSKGYVVDSYGPITITFTAGNEPTVNDDIEIYGFGYIS